MKPYTYTITESLEKLSAGELCSRELVESCLLRIEETDSEICSFITVESERALLRADHEDLSLIHI